MAYLAWFFSIILTLLDWMALRSLIRSVVIQVLAAIPTEQRVERRLHPHLLIPAVDQIVALALGVVALGLVFAIEHVYRTAAAQGTLKRRFIQTVAWQVGVLIVCSIFMLILTII